MNKRNPLRLRTLALIVAHGLLALAIVAGGHHLLNHGCALVEVRGPHGPLGMPELDAGQRLQVFCDGDCSLTSSQPSVLRVEERDGVSVLVGLRPGDAELIACVQGRERQRIPVVVRAAPGLSLAMRL